MNDMGSYFSQFFGFILMVVVLYVFFVKKLFDNDKNSYDGFDDLSKNSLDYGEISRLREAAKTEKYSRKKAIRNNTAIYLPRIGEDFPGFNYPEMKRRAQATLVSYLRAIDQEDPSLLTEGGAELKTSLKMHLNMLKDQGIHENFDDIKIHCMEISQYFKDPGRCIITFQSALECHHNRIKDGEVTEGSEELTYQTKFELEMVYIQDRDKVEDDSERAMGYNCPNCGAPVKSLKTKVCEYCGAVIEEYNIKVWTITSIREI